MLENRKRIYDSAPTPSRRVPKVGISRKPTATTNGVDPTLPR